MHIEEPLLYQDYLKTLKFIRREDLTPEIRLSIASQVLYFNYYGLVTKLSNEYNISREYIYQLRNRLQNWTVIIFGVNDKLVQTSSGGVSDERIQIMKLILSLRLEGKCPIVGISCILKRFNYSISSVGFISELLQGIGEQLPHHLDFSKKLKVCVIFGSDELFSKSQPILLTIDPVSSAILSIKLSENRKGESWKQEWEILKSNGVVPLYIVNDEGTGMASAQKEVLKNTPRQSDTFHALAHRLGRIALKLERKAFSCIKEEYEREAIFIRAKGAAHQAKQWLNYEKAYEKTVVAIEQYDAFHQIYVMMLQQLAVFDAEAKVRDADESKMNIKKGLIALKELNQTKTINGLADQIKAIEGILPNLFYFLSVAKNIVSKLDKEALHPQHKEALKYLYKAWQYQKKWMKTKITKFKTKFKQKVEDKLICAQLLLESEQHTNFDFQSYWKSVQKQLDQIVQSSSLVESINAFIRKYLNVSSNHIFQHQLNLLMFYHNHRKYINGKRKGFSPMELLTGQKQHKDWIEILFDNIKI